MKNNFIIILIAIFLLTSCSGFKLKRSQKADEFLIEKKNPLVMPPDIDELPKPKSETSQEEEITGDFKEVLNKDSNENNQNNSSSNSSLKESIIKKIEE